MEPSRRVGEEDMVVMRYDLRTSGSVRHDRGACEDVEDSRGVSMVRAGCGMLVVRGRVTPFLSCALELSRRRPEVCCVRICVVVVALQTVVVAGLARDVMFAVASAREVFIVEAMVVVLCLL